MSDTPFLILSPWESPDSLRIAAAAHAAGWNLHRLSSWRIPDTLRSVRRPVVYGEALFTWHVAHELDLVFLEAPSSWLTDLPEEFTKRLIRHLTLGEARILTERAFIKPAGDKAFEAAIYEDGSTLPKDINDTVPVLVSEIVSWEAEYRCVVLEGEVLTHCLYERNGQFYPEHREHDEDWKAAGDFLSNVLKNTDCPPAFVVDVGIIAGRGWAVLEANPLRGSGIYGCDEAQVITALGRSCYRRESLSEPDSRWEAEWVSWD